MFTDAEKISIRRYCGYPAFGNEATQAFGHRFMTHYGAMEYKLLHLSVEEEAVVRNTYLANLPTLEADIVGTRQNMDTASAAVWTRNPREMAERRALYRQWRTDLCNFIGIPPGPGLKAAGVSISV